MNTNFNFFVNGIKEKTGIDVSVFNEKGVLVCGDVKIELPQNIPDGVVSDRERDITIFSVNSKFNKYYCVIKGSNEVEKNYAVFIAEFAKSFFSLSDFTKSELIKAGTLGELNSSEILRYADAIGIPEGRCVVMIATIKTGKLKDVEDVFLGYGKKQRDIITEINSKQCMLTVFNEGFEEEYRSVQEYAEFLVRSAFEETGISVRLSVGSTVESVGEIRTSYLQALSESKGGAEIELGGEVCVFNENLFERILRDLSENKREEYVKTSITQGLKEVFSDIELTETAEGFINNGLNASKTSRELFLHRNTLNYRLDKIKKITGLDVRDFSDALTFKIIYSLYNAVK